jgi:hypothetical protein
MAAVSACHQKCCRNATVGAALFPPLCFHIPASRPPHSISILHLIDGMHPSAAGAQGPLFRVGPE